jgi:oxygen-dependent protoporphyrinogen oxidase
VAARLGGDARATEVAAAFPEWKKAEEEHGSLAVGLARAARANRADKPAWAPRSVFTLQGGMQVLVDHLASELGDRLQLRTPVTAVVARGRGWRVETTDGRIDAEHVVVACPPRAAERFLPDLDELPAMPAAPIASVHLGWGEGVDLDGFGWIAPSSERTDVLGAIWVTGLFPDQAPGAMVRVMLGGARDRRCIEGDDQALVAHATRVVQEVQGIDATPDITHVAVHRPGIPQYPPGHTARVARLQAAHDTVHFVGWGYTGAGVPHCIEASLALADTLAGVRAG